ncbi:MAG: hypothetical protein HYR73_02490 [Candidatus Eisenbacteria bacterium]|nr:hypothetical protein [Candidatus Eisenbacteria bacterium]
MRNSELELAIQDVLDGVATRAQSDWLRHRIATDPEARALYDERETLFQMLDPGPMIEPPDDLAPGVMRAIGSTRARHLDHATGIDWVRGALTRRPIWGWVYGFGAGAAIGALVVSALSGPRPQPGREALPVSGTMAPPTAIEPAVARAQLAAGTARATVELRRTAGALWATVATTADGPAELTLEFDPAALSAIAFDWGQHAGDQIEIGPGQVRVGSHGAADARLRLAEGAGRAPRVRVVLRSGGASSSAVAALGPLPRESP